MEQQDLIDATVLVSVKFVGQKDQERFETYFGRISGFQPSDRYENLEDGSSVDLLLIECHDGITREYPFDPEVFEPAGPGLYELKDGTTLEDPDYVLEWTVTEPVKH